MKQFLQDFWNRLKIPLTWATITPLLVNVILPVLFTSLSTAQLQAINAGLSIIALLFFGISAGVSAVRARRLQARIRANSGSSPR